MGPSHAMQRVSATKQKNQKKQRQGKNGKRKDMTRERHELAGRGQRLARLGVYFAFRRLVA